MENIFNFFVGKNVHSLEKEIGIAKSSYWIWKSGKAKPSVEALKKIADYFNVSIDYLVGREKPSQDGTDDVIPPYIPVNMVERLKRLSNHEWKGIESLLDVYDQQKGVKKKNTDGNIDIQA